MPKKRKIVATKLKRGLKKEILSNFENKKKVKVKTNSKPQLYPYQREGANKLDDLNGVSLIGDEMGLGKSCQALTFCRRNPDTAPPIVIVCPAFLCNNWANEVRLWTNWQPFIIDSNNIQKVTGTMTRKPEVVIINYEKVENWLAFFDVLQPNTVIFDETQYIKNREAKRTQAATVLALGTDEKPRLIPHRMGLSGTATENGRPVELYPICNILWPKKFKSFQAYAQRYCDPQFTRFGWTYNGATNVDELHQRLTTLGMIRRLKKDVLKDLPKTTIQVLPVDIPRKEYEDAETNFISWLHKKYGPKKAAKAMRAEFIVRLGHLIRLAARKKMPIVKEWIEDFADNTSKNRKLIVFGKHKSVLKQLHEMFPHESTIITGDVPIKKRPEICRDFQMNMNTRYLFGNYASMGVGLNLVAASDGLLIETDWTPGKHSQAIARMSRIGQKNKVMITWMVARNTVEEKLCALVRRKEELNAAILDGSDASVEFDVLDQLTEELLG